MANLLEEALIKMHEARKASPDAPPQDNTVMSAEDMRNFQQAHWPERQPGQPDLGTTDRLVNASPPTTEPLGWSRAPSFPEPAPPTIQESTDPVIAAMARRAQQAETDKQDMERKAALLKWTAENAQDPAKTALVRRYAAAYPELDPAFIEQNLDMVRKKSRVAGFDWQRMIEEHPVFADLVGDPTTAPLALDDAATLSGVESVLGRWETYAASEDYVDLDGTVTPQGAPVKRLVTPPQWAAAIRDAFTGDLDILMYRAQKFVGITPELPDIDPITGRRYGLMSNVEEGRVREDYEQYLKDHATEGRDYIGYTGDGTIGRAKHAVASAWLFPFKTAPMLVGTALSGGLGAVVGASGTAGMAVFNTLYAAPGMYDRFSHIRTADGREMSPTAARAATIIGAPLVGWIMTKGLSNTFTGYAEKALEEAGAATVARALGDRTLMDTLGRWGALHTVHVLEGASGFAMQSAVDAGVEQLARSWGLGEEANPRVVYEAAWQGFKQGLVDMQMLAGFGAGRDLIDNFGKLRQANQTRASWRIMADANEAAKHPEMIDEVARRTAAQPGSVTHGYLDMRVFQETAEKAGLDPREVMADVFGDNGEAYDNAVRQGTADIAIPVDKARKMIGSRVFGDMWEAEARMHPEDDSIGTLTRQMEHAAKLAEDASKKSVDQMDPEEKGIYDAEFEKAATAVDHPGNKDLADKKEEIADAHARMVLRVVKNFKEIAAQNKSPEATLSEWYDRTFGPNGIWKAEWSLEKQFFDLKVPQKGAVVRWSKADPDTLYEVVGMGARVDGRRMMLIEDGNGTPHEVPQDELYTREEQFKIDPRSKLTANDLKEMRDRKWAGMQYTVEGGSELKATPVEWENVSGAVTTDHGGRPVEWASKDGRWTIAPILDTGKWVLGDAGASAGVFKSIAEAKAVAEKYNTELVIRPETQHIVITDTANQKTLAHEFAHAFIDVLMGLAKSEGGEFKKLYAQFTEAMGYTKPEDRKISGDRPGGDYQSVREERLAHAFEQFLFEGKAPSVEMAPVFARFVAWGAAIARRWGMSSGPEAAARHWRSRFEQAGNTKLENDVVAGRAKEEPPPLPLDPTGAKRGEPLNPALRELFSRMLAASEEVEQAQAYTQAGMAWQEVLKGLPEEERAAYQKLIDGMTLNAQATLLKQIAEATRRENSSFFKAEYGKLEKIVQRELAFNRTYRAMRFFKKGAGLSPEEQSILTDDQGRPYRIWSEDILKRYGTEYGGQIIEELRKIDPAILTTDSKRAVDLDTAAKLFGFDADGQVGSDPTIVAGKDPVERLLSALITAKPEEQFVKDETTARLKKIYGTDLLENPKELQDKALDAVINEKMAEKVIREMAFLARSLDPDRAARSRSLDKGQFELLAERILSVKGMGDINPEAFARALAKHTQNARDFAKAGDNAKAWDSSEVALLNVYLYRASRKLADALGKAYDHMAERTSTDAWRAKLGKADIRYRNLHDAILEAIGIRPMPDGKTPIGAGALDDFLAAVTERAQDDQVDGWDQNIVRGVLSGERQWKDLKPGEAKHVYNAVLNIAHLASQVNEIRIGNEVRSLDEAAQSIVADLEKLPYKGKAPRDLALVSNLREPGLKVQAFLATSEEMLTLAQMIGPNFKKLIYDAYIAGKYDEFNLSETIQTKMKEAWDALPQEAKDKAFEVLDGSDRMLPVPEDSNLEQGPISRSNLWMIMLNMGNEGNRMRLLRGMGWTLDQVIGAAEKYLSHPEMEFIQKIWNMSEEHLLPRLKIKEERKSGLPFEAVEPMPLTLKLGGEERTYPGGYFAAKYDPRASMRAINEGIERTQDGPVKMRPGTVKSHTYSRADNYADIVNLNWGVVPTHFSEVIHDIAFDEYVRNTNKLIFNKKFRVPDAMYQRLGEERARQPRAFLESVAYGQADSVSAHMARTLGLLDAAKSRVVYGSLGYNIPVAMADFLHPIAVAAFGRLKFADMAQSLAYTVAGYSEMRDFAISRSTELKIRAAHSNAKLHEQLLIARRGGAPNGYSKAVEIVRRNGFILLDHTDRIVSTQIWTAKYREMIKSGAEESKAIAEADDAVRGAMPTHITAEMPALLRDRRTFGALFMFQGYYSKLLQMSRLNAHEAYMKWHEPGVDPMAALGVTAVASMRIAAGLAVASVLGDYMMGHGKEKDESWGEWWARKSLVAPFTMVPGLANVAEPAVDLLVSGKVRKISLRNAPVLAAAQQIVDSIGKLASDKRTETQKAWDVVELLLFGAGLPSRQPRRTGEYLTNLANGEDVGDPFDFVSGVMYGKRRKQPANPFSDISDSMRSR